MRGVIDYCINRSLIVNLLTVIILGTGTWALLELQKEIFPKVEFDYIIVKAVYPGSSAEDVEKLVTIEIERSVSGVEGIKQFDAMSMEGSSVTFIEVDPDYDVDEVLDDVKDAVDLIDDFPEDVDPPFIQKMDNRHRPAITVSLTGGTYTQLRTAAKKLRDHLELNKHISSVTLGGYYQDEIRVEIDPAKLNKYELTINDVAQSIQDRNLNLSAGKIEAKTGDIIVRTLAEFGGPKDIEKVVVRSNTTGRKVLISDIAKVVQAPIDGSILERSQGERAIFLNVKIKESADMVDTAKEVKSDTENFITKEKYPNIKYRYTNDMSYYVQRRLDILKENGLIGLALVFSCLLLFLNFRSSVITSLGAPIAFMISFIFMLIFDVSLNMISMFALILVLGMLVDDSIIVAEHYYNKLEKGIVPRKAALDAAHETIKPVMATILTTMVAFGSLFFMGGIMGKFLWSVPAVVIICLLASLLECFFILPSHLNDFVKLSKKKLGHQKRWYDFLVNGYGKLLKFCLRRPVKVVAVFILVFISAIFVAKTMKVELFPGDDVRVVYLQLRGKIGTPLDITDEAMKKLETMTLSTVAEEELDQIQASIGKKVGRHDTKIGTHYASLMIYLTPPDERERSTDEILGELTDKAKKLVTNFEITTKKMQGGPPIGKPVDIEIIGDDLDELYTVSQKVLKLLGTMPGVSGPEIDFEVGKKQLVVDINDQETRRLGLTTRQIAFELRRLLGRDELTEIRNSDEDIEIKIFLDEESRTKVESLSMIHIMNNQGRRIPLVKVAKFYDDEGAFVIRRHNKKRIISVMSLLDKSVTTPMKIAKELRPKIRNILKDHPEVRFQFGGEHKDTGDHFGRLMKCAVIALVGIFFILVFMFGSLAQPVVIMSAIPLGLVGVVYTFKVMGLSLGFMAFMGIVALIGVVVNDSIVLVNFINKRREEVTSVTEAIFEASRSRFRPVILTTFTTVAGLMPLAHLRTGDPFIRPMAISFAWGLLLATGVTLVFVPCSYLIQVKSYRFIKKVIGKFSSSRPSTVGNE